MGAESSKKVVRAQKEYFTPEERQSVLAAAQKLAGSSGNITLPALEVSRKPSLLRELRASDSATFFCHLCSFKVVLSVL